MRRFIYKVLLFKLIIVSIFIMGLILPPTPRVSTSLLFAKIDKDSLLKHTPSPRIIFVGGSSLSFGLNSQLIKDSLNINPINTGIIAALGLTYMLRHTSKYIKKGDIVILVPEYYQFYDEFSYGEKELIISALDINNFELDELTFDQVKKNYVYLPEYSFSKFSPKEYIFRNESNLYLRSSFNKYGDAYKHWALDNHRIDPIPTFGSRFNYKVIDEVLRFRDSIIYKGAQLFFTYPPLESKSFENCKNQILTIEEELRKAGITILGTPSQYSFEDSLMFDSVNHLTKTGVDMRTKILISDIKKQINI